MREGFAGRLAASFIDSKLTPLLIISALLVGIFAAYLTPREEEPQIILPVVDIYVGFPGGSPDEIAERVTRPLEQAISTIPGVEFVYSASRQDMSLITVRFYVGDDTEESLVKLWSTLLKNADKMPPGVQFPPLMRSKSIDDVPVLTLTLWSDQYDGYQLRRVGQELATELKKVENVADLTVTGGQKRQIKITLDPARMQAFRVDPLRIAGQIQAANSSLSVGEFPRLNQQFQVETGDFLQNIDDVRSLVVGVFDQRPVYLHMVADV
ncbi:MAG TPA: efflux RND transporter permease subunit, partial [Calditrichia bacterium]|nr:efflux RND transporter permease subunit [Calditrichia bacterium]